MLVEPQFVSDLRVSFASHGFDLLRSAPVGEYNDLVEEAYQLPDFDNPKSLAVLVGNTRSLWKTFAQSLAETPTLRERDNPLDSWTEERFADILETVEMGYVCRFAHGGGQDIVAMQTLAQVSGMAFRGPSHLSVHRQHGPWVSFRGAIVFDIAVTQAALSAIDTCAGCAAKPCLAALETARQHSDGLSHESVKAHWTIWAGVRAACPVGSDSRFPEAQIAYHYTHERKWLDESLDGVS